MKLRGGFSASSRSRNCSSAARGPSTSMKTPCGELLTQPATASSVASRKTNGRKPTPCTAPRTASFSASFRRRKWLRDGLHSSTSNYYIPIQTSALIFGCQSMHRNCQKRVCAMADFEHGLCLVESDARSFHHGRSGADGGRTPRSRRARAGCWPCACAWGP